MLGMVDLDDIDDWEPQLSDALAAAPQYIKDARDN